LGATAGHDSSEADVAARTGFNWRRTDGVGVAQPWAGADDSDSADEEYMAAAVKAANFMHKKVSRCVPSSQSELAQPK
jgi:hypothetical protein